MMSIKISHYQFNQEINLKSDNHNKKEKRKTRTIQLFNQCQLAIYKETNKKTNFFLFSKATISPKQVQIDIIVNKIRQSKLIKNEFDMLCLPCRGPWFSLLRLKRKAKPRGGSGMVTGSSYSDPGFAGELEIFQGF